MAVWAGRGATEIQIAKVSDIPFGGYSPNPRIGIEPLQVVPGSRDRAIDLMHPGGTVVVATTGDGTISLTSVLGTQPDKSEGIGQVISIKYLIGIPGSKQQLKQV
jgi:hypothetical protein